MAVTDEQIRAIYGSTIDALYGYVSRRCGGDRALAEDITQETWLRAVREWAKRGAPDRPLAWLTTVAHNLLANHFRRVPPVSLDVVNPGAVIDAIDTGRTHDQAEVAVAVNQALSRLPREQSRLIEAFHYEEQRVSDIARAMGMSERAVEGRLRRAREKLRIELESAFRKKGEVT